MRPVALSGRLILAGIALGITAPGVEAGPAGAKLTVSALTASAINNGKIARISIIVGRGLKNSRMTHSSISLASTDQNALGAAADEHLTDILCCRRSRLQWREHHGDALEVYVSEPCPAEPSPISGTFVCREGQGLPQSLW